MNEENGVENGGVTGEDHERIFCETKDKQQSTKIFWIVTELLLRIKMCLGTNKWKQ